MFDLQWLGWIIAGVNIIGAVLNARLNRICFLFFLMSSISWIFYNVYTKTYEQIPLWVFFTATNIYGLYYWSKTKSKKGKLFNTDEPIITIDDDRKKANVDNNKRRTGLRKIIFRDGDEHS